MRGWLDAFDLLASNLSWPARSPDLNPIESLRGLMPRMAYGVGPQHEDGEELLESILKRWPEIDANRLKSSARSTNKRCLSAAKAKGGS